MRGRARTTFVSCPLVRWKHLLPQGGTYNTFSDCTKSYQTFVTIDQRAASVRLSPWVRKSQALNAYWVLTCRPAIPFRPSQRHLWRHFCSSIAAIGTPGARCRTKVIPTTAPSRSIFGVRVVCIRTPEHSCGRKMATKCDIMRQGLRMQGVSTSISKAAG